MKPLRLAQFTDLHARLHQSGTSDSPERLSRVVPELLPRALARLDVDFVALTGDLLDVPDSGREPAAILADYRWLRATLEAWGGRWCVLPGNHDDSAAMLAVFGDLPREWHVDGWRLVSFWDEEGDAHVPQRRGERARCERLLGEPGPQVHLQHYVTYPPLVAGWPYNFADAEEQGARLAESPAVAACLAGHYHAGLAPERVGGCWFATGPAFAYAPHRWVVYTLDGEHCDREDFSLG